jgi:hypothetical protein
VAPFRGGGPEVVGAVLLMEEQGAPAPAAELGA